LKRGELGADCGRRPLRGLDAKTAVRCGRSPQSQSGFRPWRNGGSERARRMCIGGNEDVGSGGQVRGARALHVPAHVRIHVLLRLCVGRARRESQGVELAQGDLRQRRIREGVSAERGAVEGGRVFGVAGLGSLVGVIDGATSCLSQQFRGTAHHVRIRLSPGPSPVWLVLGRGRQYHGKKREYLSTIVG
jgi:hypothetical protein